MKPGTFWYVNHPSGTVIVGEANCSTIAFGAGIILLLCLVYQDRREHILRLLYGEGPDAFQVNSDPSGILIVL